jgi:hypothetical protein
MTPRTFRAVIIPLLLVGSVRADEASAVAALKKLGAKIKVDETKPDKPVVEVDLAFGKVTEAGLAELKQFKQLARLNLQGASNNITDEKMKHLKELKKLTELNLIDAKITDAGLRELKDLDQLEILHLLFTPVTDAGINELKGLKQLKRLRVKGSKVTAAGAKDFQDALPKCMVER